MRNLYETVNDVLNELRRAEMQHPGWPDDVFRQLTIIGEEYGEAQKAALQAEYDGKDPDRVRQEVTRVAAMAIRFLYNF